MPRWLVALDGAAALVTPFPVLRPGDEDPASGVWPSTATLDAVEIEDGGVPPTGLEVTP